MRTDRYGQIILDEQDLCEAYMSNPQAKLRQVLVEDIPNISADLEISNLPEMVKYVESDLDVEDFDRQMQSNWQMPAEYLELDIAVWLLERCKTEAELQRVGQELLLYQERGLFTLLQYLKYLVDTLRSNNIVWGVGRGSSVSSYVLYLIGVHRINSLYWDLDIQEFLR